MASTMDLTPSCTLPKSSRNAPASKKNASREAKTAPPLTVSGSALTFMYERLIE